MSSDSSMRWKMIAAFGAVYIIWGSTYLFISFAIETLPPFLMAGTRFIVAGGLLYGWQRLRGEPNPPRLHWRSAAIIGGLLLVGGNGGVTWAEQKVPSGLTALVIGATPIWITLLGWIAFGGTRPNRFMALGLGIGLAGVALLIGPANLLGGDELDPMGTLALIFASMAWATGSLYSRRAPMPHAPLMGTAIEMLAGGALLWIVGLLAGDAGNLNLSGVSLKSAFSLVYLTIFGSMLAFSAYVWLLGHTTPQRATSYAYVNPVVAVILGWAFAGEDLGPRTIIAAAIIIASVVLVTSARAQSKIKTPSPTPILPETDGIAVCASK